MKKLLNLVVIFVLGGILLSVPAQSQETFGEVTLTESGVTWQTVAYELDENLAFVPGSLDTNIVVEREFITYVLENDYLRVTLLPEFGGRILSMIYKPTGHEQLYQNPLGRPYGIGDGNFYFDWLMVYGGIFPTFPEPEHGKAWFLPWSFDVITEAADEITIRMSFVDDSEFAGAPARFDPRPTGMEVDYFVTLRAGETRLDTEIVLRNPTDRTITYEYWTSLTLAPGSEPDDTRSTTDTEIIAPIERVKMPPWWPETIAQEQATGVPDIYLFDNLRRFENWADMGIAYAHPDSSSMRFWGVINHTNEEGLIRIGDNTVTRGLKIWTWGSDSLDIPESDYTQTEHRPYVELWSGITPEFFSPTTLSPDSELVFQEHYIPTVGLTNVTHANEEVLANFFHESDDRIQLQVFNPTPTQEIQITIMADSEVIYDAPMVSDPSSATVIAVDIPTDTQNVTFELLAEDISLLDGMLSSSEAQ